MPQKTQVFTDSGTFNVPSTVSAVIAMWIAGGAGGAGNPTSSQSAGQIGGGSGEFTINRMIPVTPSGTLAIVIGPGGTGGPGGGGPGFDGGVSSVGDFDMLGGLVTTDGINHGDGGGPRGGQSFFGGGGIGHMTAGLAESPTSFGGCGAGLGGGSGAQPSGTTQSDGQTVQVIGQYAPTSGAAVPACHGGGGCGGVSFLGRGGIGSAANDGNSGNGWNSSAPGAGGGGACGTGVCAPVRVNLSGGNGFKGYAMLMWTEP